VKKSQFLEPPYNRKGNLRNRHKNIKIDQSFRTSQIITGVSYRYRIDGYTESKEVFEFFANNTVVEWAHLIFVDENTGHVRAEISTDHHEVFVTFNYPASLKYGSYTLVDVRHSHPRGFISKYDRDAH
jgi:hypothetical protein